MAEEKYILFIVSETAPPGAADGWFWFDSVNKKLFRYQGYADGSWVEKPLIIPVDIKFTGKIKADALEGKTVAIPYSKPGGGTGTLHFHDGIFVNNT